MSTVGLRKLGNFESALAQANRDEQHIGGVINPHLSNAATKIINSPYFQRVKDQLSNNLVEQQIQHISHQTFENHVTHLATESSVNRHDLDNVINLAQPPPPPPPQMPNNDAAADRERL